MSASDLFNQGIQVGFDRFFVTLAACVVEELRDDGIHLLDVGHDGIPRPLIGNRQFALEAQACQRRAQVVRNAGQHFGAFGGDLFQVVRHAVEGFRYLPQFAGPCDTDRVWVSALSQFSRGIGQRTQRSGDA